MARPFIVWTLRRTGGTNLTARLEDRYDRSGEVEHEPFNRGRVFGKVTTNWEQTQDEAQLDASVRGIVARFPLIKHCLETVPVRVTSALVRAACSHNTYRHVFLYRRDPLVRLLSLHFAQTSGVWGPEFKKEQDKIDMVLKEPLPVQKLIAHEAECVERYSTVNEEILSYDRTIFPIAFEDIYQADSMESVAVLVDELFSYLDINMNRQELEAFVREITSRGNQNTNQIYKQFKGIQILREELKAIGHFIPQTEK